MESHVNLKMSRVQALLISMALNEARHACAVEEDCWFCMEYAEIESRLRQALSA